VLRPVDPDVFDEVQLQMNEPEFRKKISERMWKMEGLFADAKQNRYLAWAKYRGRPKVQIQAYLIAIVQNLKPLLFPLYYWLLARCWSCSTNTVPALPSNRSRPSTSC
jgi:predicted phosphoadenosine phosphosulfate sulfurtransferase